MSGSLNRYATEIIESGIFNNVRNFKDFLSRVSNTKELNNRGVSKTKGDIFEIFSESLLNVDKRFQAKKVYPQGYVPPLILKKLRMHDEDYGYDGLYITHDDKHIIYQSKFRSNNEKIKWQGENGLSSFVGVSKRVDNYHLISASTDVSKYFLNVENILLSTGNDLNKLEKDIFDKIEKWLKKKKYKSIGIHKPDKYQIIALNKIGGELKKKSRTTVVMACGTGKTDVGFWYYQSLNTRLTLVLVPSIALVKQIRSDWLSQIQKKVVTFQLCSSKDTSKKDDEYILEKKDLGMTIETDPKILKKWLSKYKNENKIIFSTYQSSKIIQKALGNKQFVDLAIFDEAHRTATVKKNLDSNFNFALFDKNIKIKKRLFMTATRRIVSSKQVDTSGSGKLLVSMDNEEIYGKICYNLSFFDAAKKYKAIARPKIILSEVLSSEVDEFRTKNSSTDVKGEKVKSDYLARQISLKKAIINKKIKKVFCFHNSVPQSKTFTDSTKPESIGFHLKNFYTDYVSGAMRMNLRDKKMDLFKSSRNAIISNARCLIEGVDVPTVGMVSFISQKRSEIDIVQAIGRSLRNRSDPNKKYGYIHVPIFVNKYKNQTLADAVDESNFDNLILIIKALKEHDDEISQIIDEILISESRGKGFSKKAAERLSEIIENDYSVIPKKIINQSIKSKIISNIRLKWDEMIGRLLAFRDKYGNLNVRIEQKEFKDLYEWILRIRRLYQKNKLLKFQIEKLNEINFPWSDNRADILNTKNFLPRRALARKFKLDAGTIETLVKNKKIKSVGKGFLQGSGLTVLYKNYTEKEFLKICGIDFLPSKHKFVSAGFLAQKYNLNVLTLLKAIRNQSVGKTFTTQSISNVYKNYNSKELCKLLGVDILNTKNLYTLNSLAVLVGDKGRNHQMKYLLKKKLIKPVGLGISSQGKSLYFKKITKEKFMKLMNIDLMNVDGLYTIKRLHQKLGIAYYALDKLKSSLDYVGRGFSNNGISDFYKDISKVEFYKRLGIIQGKKGLYTLSALRDLIQKKYKRAPHNERDLKIVLDKNKIKPIGKIISKAKGFSDVYKMINVNEYKKIMGIDILNPGKNVMSLFEISEKYGYWFPRLKRLAKFKKIKYIGKGFTSKSVTDLYLYPGEKLRRIK